VKGVDAEGSIRFEEARVDRRLVSWQPAPRLDHLQREGSLQVGVVHLWKETRFLDIARAKYVSLRELLHRLGWFLGKKPGF
jgi:hypothetical protein